MGRAMVGHALAKELLPASKSQGLQQLAAGVGGRACAVGGESAGKRAGLRVGRGRVGAQAGGVSHARASDVGGDGLQQLAALRRPGRGRAGALLSGGRGGGDRSEDQARVASRCRRGRLRRPFQTLVIGTSKQQWALPAQL